VLHNSSFFYGEALLAPRPTPKLEDHRSSAVLDCLFNLFATTLHTGGLASSPLASAARQDRTIPPPLPSCTPACEIKLKAKMKPNYLQNIGSYQGVRTHCLCYKHQWVKNAKDIFQKGSRALPVYLSGSDVKTGEGASTIYRWPTLR
jgi:hypothetical protein